MAPFRQCATHNSSTTARRSDVLVSLQRSSNPWVELCVQPGEKKWQTYTVLFACLAAAPLMLLPHVWRATHTEHSQTTQEFMSVYTNWMTDSCCTSTTSTSPRPHLSRPPSRPPSETHKLHAHAHAAAHMHAAAAKLCFKAASAVSAAGASAVVAAAKVPKLPLSGVPASVGVDARHIAQQQVTPHSGEQDLLHYTNPLVHASAVVCNK